MARYDYLAVDVDGHERQGGIDAANEQAARAALAGKKLLPVEYGLQAVKAQSAAPPTIFLLREDR